MAKWDLSKLNQVGHDPVDGPVHYYQAGIECIDCLLYTSPSPRDGLLSRMPSSA